MSRVPHRSLFLVPVLAFWLSGDIGAEVGRSHVHEQLCRNSDFREGLAHWTAFPDSEAVRVVFVDGGPSGTAVEMDNRCRYGEISVHSHLITVEPSTAYEVRAKVQRIAGEGRFKVAVQWLDEQQQVLGYANSWTGQLVGLDWEPHVATVLSPPEARSARLIAGIDPRCHARMTNLNLQTRPPLGAKLSVNLIAEPMPSSPDQEALLAVRLENRGDVLLSDLLCSVELPPGIESAQALEWDVGSLAYGEAARHTFTLRGRPRQIETSIRCRVTGNADGKAIEFVESTRPFVTATQPLETTGSELPEPEPVPSRIELGCYYFPVMLDWDRLNWGVRRVDYLEPLLGYYDEALPDVADWHIRWALESGISFFVFDWYWNQGMEYLNDALDKGFLGSQYAKQMKFCIDWCNEGHGTQFKPLDFSTTTLAEFIRLLCERYFRHENYLCVDGCPVVLIHQPARIVNAHGGWEGSRRALDEMRTIARSYGHRGVYFVAVHNHPVLPRYGLGGFDAVTAYAYGFSDVSWDEKSRTLSYEALIPRHQEAFAEARALAHAQELDYIPTAWTGWDDAARSKDRSIRTVGNTPAAFRSVIESLPDYVDERPGLALVEAWNEWGEGGAVEPGIQYGFGYLDALRDVLTDARGPYETFVPAEAERNRFQTELTFDQINDQYLNRYARHLGLERGLDMTFESTRDLWLQPVRHVTCLNHAQGALRGRSTGTSPQLLGPPMMKLPAEHAQTIVLELSVTSGGEGRLGWTTDSDPEFSAARSVGFPVTADGQFHKYQIDIRNHPEWRNTIRQFRLQPTDAPAEFAIQRFSTE